MKKDDPSTKGKVEAYKTFNSSRFRETPMHTIHGSKMRNKSLPSQFRSCGLGGNSKLMRMIAKNKVGPNMMVFSSS